MACSPRFANQGKGILPLPGDRALAFRGFPPVTNDSAIFYSFKDKTRERIDVLAVFLGGQDYRQQSLIR
jgi:hypothetical protein